MIKNVVLFIVLILQGLAWLIIDSPLETHRPKSAAVVQHRLEELSLDDIALIEVTDASGNALRLEKRADAGDLWVIESVQGFPAMQEKVSNALAQFANLSKADYRSSKRILHENYDVDDKRGQHVKLSNRDGSVATEFVIGKRDIKGVGTFVRKADEDHVYVIKSNDLAAAFPTDAKAWHTTSMMDVDITQRDRVTELRTSAYRIEFEGQAPKMDENMRPIQPPETEFVRYVFERVDPGAEAESAEPHWRVLEPAGSEDVRLDDLLIKNKISLLLNLRANQIIGTEVKPEYGLAEPEDMAARLVVRFKEAGEDTSRVLEVGSEFTPPSEGPRPSPPQRYARVSHPGDKLQQSFVFSVPATYHSYFLAPPATYVRKNPDRETPR